MFELTIFFIKTEKLKIEHFFDQFKMIKKYLVNYKNIQNDVGICTKKKYTPFNR